MLQKKGSLLRVKRHQVDHFRCVTLLEVYYGRDRMISALTVTGRTPECRHSLLVIMGLWETRRSVPMASKQSVYHYEDAMPA